MAEVKPVIEGNFIKFLGTAGARFVMIRQLRASGGLWVSYEGTNLLVDPGPGSIVRCALSRPRLDPAGLDALVLTHRHLDHAGDINVMIEAMTEGGFKKKGEVFAPADALGADPVILKYIRGFPSRINILKPRREYRIGKIEFTTSPGHLHPVETYGLKFKLGKKTVSLLTDTRYFPGLSTFYRGTDTLIIYVVFFKPRLGVDHLSLEDARQLLKEIRPKKAILTHFGMTMLKARPYLQAQQLSEELKRPVVAARDGQTFLLT
jgi:phosphoribosyl 1,2-cyclic phosphodiesterase